MRPENLLAGSLQQNRLRRVLPSLSAQGEGRSHNVPSEAHGPSAPCLMPRLSGLVGEGRRGAQDQDRSISAQRHGQVLNLPNTAVSLKSPAQVAQRGARDPALITLALRQDQMRQVLGRGLTLKAQAPAIRRGVWGRGNRRSDSNQG